MRDQFALILDQTRALGIGNKAAVEWGTDEIMRLIRLCPITETVDRYDGMTSTATDRVNRYALVPLPEEDE